VGAEFEVTPLFAVKSAVSASLISVDSVWPAYGPLAGGTQVTIIGQILNMYSFTDVYFGLHQGLMYNSR